MQFVVMHRLISSHPLYHIVCHVVFLTFYTWTNVNKHVMTTIKYQNKIYHFIPNYKLQQSVLSTIRFGIIFAKELPLDLLYDIKVKHIYIYIHMETNAHCKSLWHKIVGEKKLSWKRINDFSLSYLYLFWLWLLQRWW